MATNKNYSKKEVSEQMLYLRSDGTFIFEPAFGPPVAKGGSWCILEIRSKGDSRPMFSLQYTPWREWSSILPKNVKRNRAKRNGKTRER